MGHKNLGVCDSKQMTSYKMRAALLVPALVLASSSPSPVATFKPTMFSPSGGALSPLSLRQPAMYVAAPILKPCCIKMATSTSPLRYHQISLY